MNYSNSDIALEWINWMKYTLSEQNKQITEFIKIYNFCKLFI
jgi:hypothetical protein